MRLFSKRLLPLAPLPLAPLLLVALFLAACEGPTGPPGPPGLPGGGLAAEHFEVDFLTGEAAVDGFFASTAYDAPEITPAVVEEGVVVAYFREGETWTALPYTYGAESTEVPAVDYTVTLGYAYEQGFLEVFYELSLEDEELLRSLPDQRIKVVVLGRRPSTRAVDLGRYESVRKRYGLQE